MEQPEFFARLRKEVKDLREAPPSPFVSAFHTVYSHPDPEDGAGVAVPTAPFMNIRERDDRTARLNKLMTQAVIGADLVVGPTQAAPEVWLPHIVDYLKGGAPRPGEWKLIQGLIYHRAAGHVFAHFIDTTTEIVDLFGVAAAFLGHLETKAMPPIKPPSVPPLPAGDGVRVLDDRVPFTIKDCAERLGVSDDQIGRLIKAGKLRAFKVGSRSWRINQSELERFCAAAPEKYPNKKR